MLAYQQAGAQHWGAGLTTTRDIADSLGLSVSTVGRALADDPRISVETKLRVKGAAEKIGYVRNIPAQIMRGGSSNLIGLLLPDVRNDFYSSIAQSLSETCDHSGYRLVLAITGDDRDAEHRQIRELAGAKVAGVIVVPTQTPRRETVTLFKTIPHVQLLRRSPLLSDAWFGIDDAAAMETATRHLLELGHRRIAYVGGRAQLSTGAARADGVRSAFEAMKVDPEGLSLMTGDPTIQAGERSLSALLDRHHPPTAVISGSVHVTQGLMRVITERQIAVPEALSLIGFGDPYWFAWWGRGITTIRPPIDTFATTCGLWFLDRLRSSARNGDVGPHHAVATSSFVKRGTTAPPAS